MFWERLGTMTIRRTIALLIMAAVALMWYLRLHRHPLSDEDQIRQAIGRGLEGVETRRVGKALSIVSDEYHDAGGNSKRDLVRMAAGAFQSAQMIRVFISQMDVQVEGDTAYTSMKVSVIYRDTSGEEFSEDYAPELIWRKERGKWKIVSTKGLTYPE